MTITIFPSDLALSSVTEHLRASSKTDFPESPCALLQNPLGFAPSKTRPEVFQSTFAGSENATSTSDPDRLRINKAKNGNGLVDTCLQAYNHHHGLILRPDDVWIAILTQFSYYVNANSEELRHLFVQHEGKQKLVIKAAGNRYTVDFGLLAEQMGQLISENVVDPELHGWIIPDFTTTTPNDRIVCSVVMMATLQEYFAYKFELICGLPAVTLLGEKADWERLLAKAEKLATFGPQTERWHRLLKPVLSHFVGSFINPESPTTKTFWQNIAHQEAQGSGSWSIHGWLTAFCFFGPQGQPLCPANDETVNQKGQKGNTRWWKFRSATGRLPSPSVYQLDGITYHRVKMINIPPAFASVPVELDDNGLHIDTTMIAGLVGFSASSSTGKLDDTVQPVAGWWIFTSDGSK